MSSCFTARQFRERRDSPLCLSLAFTKPTETLVIQTCHWTLQPNILSLSNTNELHPEVLNGFHRWSPNTRDHLQSIYAEDFIECPPPKVWKVSAISYSGVRYEACWVTSRALPLCVNLIFIIRVTHPDPDHASKINLRLHIKYVVVGFYTLDLHSHIDF